jgi:hypothetical protein
VASEMPQSQRANPSHPEIGPEGLRSRSMEAALPEAEGLAERLWGRCSKQLRAGRNSGGLPPFNRAPTASGNSSGSPLEGCSRQPAAALWQLARMNRVAGPACVLLLAPC